MNGKNTSITESVSGNLESFKSKMRSGRATGRDLAELFGKTDLYDRSKERTLKENFVENVAESMKKLNS